MCLQSSSILSLYQSALAIACELGCRAAVVYYDFKRWTFAHEIITARRAAFHGRQCYGFLLGYRERITEMEICFSAESPTFRIKTGPYPKSRSAAVSAESKSSNAPTSCPAWKTTNCPCTVVPNRFVSRRMREYLLVWACATPLRKNL